MPPEKKNKREEGLVKLITCLTSQIVVYFISMGPVDLHPCILNLQTCLPAIKFPALTVGKGCSKDTSAGVSLCQKLQFVSKTPRLSSTQFHVVSHCPKGTPYQFQLFFVLFHADHRGQNPDTHALSIMQDCCLYSGKRVQC